MGIKERKEREKLERRKLIQDAAKNLFQVKGFRFTTIEDIAAKAELSPGTLYQYFMSKESIYASLMLDATQSMHDEIKKLYKNNNLSVERKMSMLQAAMYKAFENDPIGFQGILHVLTENIIPVLSEELLGQVNRLIRDAMFMIAEIYQEGVRQGKFRREHTIAQVDIILGTFFGLIVWEEAKRKLNPKKQFLKQTLGKAFEIYQRGIKIDYNRQ